MSKICESIPESHRPALVRGWLLDQVPRKWESLVEITPQGGVQREARPIEFDCPDDVRHGLELLARRSVQAPVRDLILDLARLLSEDGGKK